MSAYFKLSAPAWLQLQRSWNIPVSLALTARTVLQGGLNSLFGFCQTALAGQNRASVTTEGAVFVLGFWRSGTSLLHELLCLDSRFGYPTTYACLNPHHFILSEKAVLARSKKQARRVQDNMVMTMQTPQEDEFGLMCLGARSPYEGIILPQNFGQSLSLADLDNLTPVEARHWRRTFIQFYRGVALRNHGKPLVLKSPAHSYRVEALRSLLPDARFVVITRNPYEVFESTVRTYRALAGKYGMEPPLPDDEVRDIILAERLYFEDKLLRAIRELPKEQLTIVRFEDLIADPVAVAEGIYARLGLPDFEKVRGKLQQEALRRKQYRPEATLPDEYWKGRIARAWKHIFEYYGYDV